MQVQGSFLPPSLSIPGSSVEESVLGGGFEMLMEMLKVMEMLILMMVRINTGFILCKHPPSLYLPLPQ